VTIATAAEYNEVSMRDGWLSLCDSTAIFSHPDLRRLLGAWRRSIKTGGIPRRRDITDRVLRPYRSDVVLYEKIVGESGARRWRVEKVGTSFAQIMGDLSGRFLDEALDGAILPRWEVALDVTLAAAAPLRFVNRNTKMDFLNSEYFSAPLIGEDGSANFVLAAGRFSGARKWQDIEAEARDRLGL
jgi:hypothetical protein